MDEKFSRPIFNSRELELRFENNEVCIYGTRHGLNRLASLVSKLADNPKIGHIHLEDYELLTEQSLIGAIAVFDKEG